MNKLLKTVVLATAMALPMSAIAAPPAPAAFDVTVNLTATCTVAAIAPVVFNLVAGAVPLTTATTTATVNCTQGLLYNMSVNAGGTAANIPYTLGVAANSTGTGANQGHTITATIAAGTYNNCTGTTQVGGVCTGTDNTNLFTVSF